MLVMAAAGAGVARSLEWLTTSPVFALSPERITVDGAHHASAVDIVDELAPFMGQNSFQVRLAELEARVLSRPWVARVHVGRRLPDGLVVEIDEHEPAAVAIVGDAAYLTDASGRPFKRALLHREGEGLPLVTGIHRALWQESPAAGHELVRSALRVAAAWKQQPNRPTLSEVRVTQAGFTLVTMQDAVAIRVGRALVQDLPERFSRFDAVWTGLGDEERERVTRIHLDGSTRPERVVLTLASSTMNSNMR